MSKQTIWQWLDSHEPMLNDIARQTWERPELPFQEHQAAALHADTLERADFRVCKDFPDLPTALVAEYGAGPLQSVRMERGGLKIGRASCRERVYHPV